MAVHLLFKYYIRLWVVLKDWLELQHLQPASWVAFDDVQAWWSNFVIGHEGQSKAVALLLMMFAWANWNKQNTRTSRNKSTMPLFILNSVTLDAKS
jgi:hypothetical protein